MLVLAAGGITWAAQSDDNSRATPAEVSTSNELAAAVERTDAPAAVPLPTAAPTSTSVEPVATVSVSPPSPPPVVSIPAPPLVIASGFIQNTPQVITYESGFTATVNGSYPISIQLRCTVQGCVYPLRANLPGAVAADGAALLTVEVDRLQAAVSSVQPCRGSQRTPFSRTAVTTLDLLFGDPVVSNGVSHPSTVTGTITIDLPGMGFTPPLPRVDDGREMGCYRQTIVVPIDAALTPVQ